MVRERFDESFEAMRDQSNRLAETERTAENFDEIVEQRVELDRLRDEVTNARKNIVSRYEPPATDVVEPPRGYLHTKLIGKIGAALAALLVAAAVGMVFLLVRNLDTNFLSLDDVVESVERVDTTCIWRVEATLQNSSDEQVLVERVRAVIDRGFVRGVPGFFPTIPAGESAPLIVEWTLPQSPTEPGASCPGVDEINHGNIQLMLDTGLEISTGL